MHNKSIFINEEYLYLGILESSTLPKKEITLNGKKLNLINHFFWNFIKNLLNQIK